jgi:uncharacterized repeat protein (TIGR01451 family)
MKKLLVPLSVLVMMFLAFFLFQPSQGLIGQAYGSPSQSAEGIQVKSSLHGNTVQGSPNPAWYDPAWSIRRPVTLTNPGSALTDYQVLVTLGSSFDFAHAQANGADLRVTAGDGTTPLSFWIESWDSTAQKAWVWVKVASLPGGATVIYFYYNNPLAVSASNGKATFEVYDGFEAYDVGVIPAGDYTNPGEWTRYTGNPVLEGTSGEWDATGATFASVISDTTAGEYRMYYHGWGAISPCTGSCIGLATSQDGQTWEKSSNNPVMTPTLGAWDSGGVRVPMVWKEGSSDYRMIYTGRDSGGVMQVGYAKSTDGIDWEKQNSGNPVFNEPNAWAHNSTENWGVIKVGSEYLMWYSDLNAPRESSIATSTDLITWTPYASTPIFATSGVPTDYQYSQYCPFTFRYGGYYYVLVPSYTSLSDYSRYYLYRSSNPYFPTSDRHLMRVVHTPGTGGQWDALDNDTPGVLTADVERDSFPGDRLWTYYAGASPMGGTWREGLLIEPDIAAALTEAALPSGTLTWTASGNASVVNSPVRQGVRSLRLNDTSNSMSTNIRGSFASIEKGSVGAWLRRNNTTAGDYDIYLYEGTTLAAVVGLGRNGVFHYWNKTGGYGTGFHDTTVTWSANTWYLVSLDFDAGLDKYDMVVYNQNLEEQVRQTGISFGNGVTNIDAAMLYTDLMFTGQGYADDYRLRKRVSPAPTVQVGVAEPVVDLGIAKNASAGMVYVGESLAYTLWITNASLLTAPAVIITDTLPTKVSLVSAVSTQGSCTQVNPVICSLGDMAGGESQQITIMVTAASNGVVVNTAEVSSTGVEQDGSDNTATATTTIQPSADLMVTQIDDPDPVWLGEPVTYTLTVHNDGPSALAAITLTDTLPVGVVFESATPLAYCSQTSPVVCSLPGLSAGGSSQVQVVVQTTMDGLITNMVTATSVIYDKDLGNNTSIEGTVVATQADLAVSQTDLPDPVYAGDPLTYTITVHNDGPNIAANVRLTDTLPGGVTLQSVVPSQGNCNSGVVVTCELVDLDPGEDAFVTMVVTTSLDGVITNTVEAASDTPDEHQDDNRDVITTTVAPVADLEVSQVDEPDPVRAGRSLTYTLTVHNNGPSASAAITLTDTLPMSVTLVSADPAAYCSQSSPVVCTLAGLLVGGDSQVQVVVSTTLEGLLTNTVTVASPTRDRDLENNTSVENTVVAIAADLSITQQDVPDPVLAEQELTYFLRVHNAGPSIAASVRLTDTLPGDVTLVSATPEQGICNPGIALTCELGNLPSGMDIGVNVVVIPWAAGSISNAVEVSTKTFEDHLGDNLDIEDTLVLPLSADLQLTLVDDPDPVAAGGLLTYTAHVDNLGPSRAINPSVIFDLSNEATFVTATPPCIEAGGIVTCQLDEIPAGGSADILLVARVSPSTFLSQISSQADVSAAVADPASGNNHASQDTGIFREADLAIDILDRPDPVAPDKILTYTLVYTNYGPSDAVNLSLTDQLPAAVDYIRSQPAACGAVPGTHIVNCAPLDLKAGHSAQVALVVKVKVVAQPPLVDQVDITAETADPNPDNNTSQETTGIDDKPPSIHWIEPVETESTYIVVMRPGLVITLTVTVTDNVQVDRVYFIRWDQVREEYIDIGEAKEVSPGVYQYVWVIKSTYELPPKGNQVFACAYDTAGNGGNVLNTRKRIIIFPIYPVFLPTLVR